MKRLHSRIRLLDIGQPALAMLVGLTICLFVYGFRLGSLTRGYVTSTEQMSMNSSRSVSTIIADPVNAPIKVAQYGVRKLGHHSVVAARLPSVTFGVASVFLFYYIVRKWHSSRVSVLSTILFSSSAWMLHVSRMATADILLIFTPLSIIAAGVFYRRSGRAAARPTVTNTAMVISLYTPFMFIIVLPILIWQVRSLLLGKNRPGWKVVLSNLLLMTLLAAPLVYALFKNPSILSGLANWPYSLSTGMILDSALSVFIATRGLQSERWLDSVALLDVGSAILLALGILSPLAKHRLLRIRLPLAGLALGLIASAITGQMYLIGLAIPFFYLFIAEGIDYMLLSWTRVFPRNPIARGYAITAICMVVALSSAYNLNRYFIAWPNSSRTVQAISQKL